MLNKKSIISILLTVLIVISIVPFTILTSGASTNNAIYLNAPNSFTTPTCYMWGNSGVNSNWPGEKMTLVSDSIYKYIPNGNYEKVIFSDNGSPQTDNLNFSGLGMIYDYSSNTWSKYNENETPTSPEEKPSLPEENLIQNPSFELNNGWNYISGMSKSSDKAHSGSFSAKSTVRGRSVTFASSETIKITPNTDYLFSAAIFRQDNSAWAYIDMNDCTGELQLQDKSTPGKWQYVSGVWNSGNTTSINVRAVVEPDYHNTTSDYNGISGDIWFDDISLTPINYDSYSETPPTLSDFKEEYTIENKNIKATIVSDNNKEYITKLINKNNNTNWIDTSTEMPLLNKISNKEADWQLSNIDYNNKENLNSNIADSCNFIILTYKSSNLNLTLKSYWKVYETGPLYHYSEIINTSNNNISIKTSDVLSGDILLNIPNNVNVHRFNRSRFNNGFDGHFTKGVFKEPVTKNMFLKNTVENSWLVSSGSLPFEIIHSDNNNEGFYMGYEWSYGDMLIRTQDNINKLRFTASMGYSIENVNRNPGETYLVPPVFYGAYSGSVDNGSNQMKKWFYNHLMTSSLRENENEPLIEFHLPLFEESNLINYLNNNNIYNWGVELTKMDYWWTVPDGNFDSYLEQQWNPYPTRWPNGMTYGKIVKEKFPNLKTSLYMCDTYQGVDIGTKEGQKAQINALSERLDNWKIDYWRSDFDLMIPNSYTNHEGLMHILDTLIKRDSNFRYEHCSAGGSLKDFSTLKRMTFMTMEDSGGALNHRMAFYPNSYMINPVQLKFDLGYDWTSDADAPYINAYPEKWAYYNLRTGMMGAMMVSNVSGSLTNIQEKASKESWNLYKTKQRPILKGADVYHILPMPDGINWDGMQFYNENIEKGSVFLFREKNIGSTDGSSKVIKLMGLKENATYKLTFEDRKEQNTIKTGKELMESGILVKNMNSVYDSEIIWIELETKEEPSTEPTSTTEPTTKPEVKYKKGDVNQDNIVNIKDVTCIQLYLVGSIKLTPEQIALGNVSNSDSLSIKDVTILQRYIAQLIDEL